MSVFRLRTKEVDNPPPKFRTDGFRIHLSDQILSQHFHILNVHQLNTNIKNSSAGFTCFSFAGGRGWTGCVLLIEGSSIPHLFHWIIGINIVKITLPFTLRCLLVSCVVGQQYRAGLRLPSHTVTGSFRTQKHDINYNPSPKRDFNKLAEPQQVYSCRKTRRGLIPRTTRATQMVVCVEAPPYSLTGCLSRNKTPAKRNNDYVITGFCFAACRLCGFVLL